MVVQYKCPGCGADMSFNSETGTLHCASCNRSEHISTYEIQDDSNQEKNNSTYIEHDINSLMLDENKTVQYICNNCGAEIITEVSTAATTCTFCGAGVILSDRLTGKLSPTKIIPFSVSKEQAEHAFKKWCKKGFLTPRGFMTADRVKNMTGIYIPFWLYNLNGIGEVNATCTKVRHYTKGEYDYTETSYYNVYRRADLSYQNIPVDASTRMDDNMMDKLEPFDYSSLNQFQMPYLAGFVADKYDMTDRQLFPRVKKRVDQFVESYLRSTISGYSNISIHSKRINVTGDHAEYALLPVWMICYDYKDMEHTFMMNGQTGKIIGKPPLSKGKIAAWFSGISLTVFALLQLVVLLL